MNETGGEAGRWVVGDMVREGKDEERERKQGCQEESVKSRRHPFALYLLTLFPGHFP